ncbi:MULTISPECIES: hypothetical protein [unclassified Sedimentibacter]|uniref:hypothetical protein n=1 Tax=unclassified Sedimentibacter TaxID=2649220 RepID=UPI0027E19356|nr:hypothetical protein [Sedimentibacter sp. MB35-C1]WMJ76018.1 hypothetical protein RBQ61_10280 [Sedimentibacter sp. MB35-C1]
MKKIGGILLVIVVTSILTGCSAPLMETDAKENMFIKSVALSEDERIKTPIVGFLPKIYEYSVDESIKAMMIEVIDYTDTYNPIVVNSYAYKLYKESTKGRIYIIYYPDENELNIEINSKKRKDKNSSVLYVYDKNDSYAMSFNNESVIRKEEAIPLIAILYADSFSEVDRFLNNPKKYRGYYSTAYQIKITFFDKDLNSN